MAGIDRDDPTILFEANDGGGCESIVLGGAGEIGVDPDGQIRETGAVGRHQPNRGVDSRGDHPGTDTLARNIGDGGDQRIAIFKGVVGVAGDVAARRGLGHEAVTLDFGKDLGIEVGLDDRGHLHLASQPFAFEGFESQADGFHGNRDLDGKKLEKPNVVGGKGLGARAGLFVRGDQDSKSSILGDERDGRHLFGVDTVVPRLGQTVIIDGRTAETPEAFGRGCIIAEIDVSTADAEEGDEVADELFGNPFGLQDSADAAGNGANGLEFPEMETLVKTSPLELFAELPSPESETSGQKDRLFELLRFEQVEAPAGNIAGEGYRRPSFGGLFDLARDGAWPSGVVIAVTTQNTGPRTGLFDNRSQQVLSELWTLVAAECGVGEAKEFRQRDHP